MALLADTYTTGDCVIALALVAKAGLNPEVAAYIEKLGGKVRYRFDEVDFMTVHIEYDDVSRVLHHQGVLAIQVDRPVVATHAGSQPTAEALDFPGTSASRTPTKHWPPIPTDYPLTHSHSVLKDMDAWELRKAHPEYDGRGVVIAHIEWWPDFLSAELKTAYGIGGNPIPKFVDVISVPELLPTLEENPTISNSLEWFRLNDLVSGGGSAEFRGRKYYLPEQGTFRFGEFTLDGSARNRGGYEEAVEMLSKFYPPDDSGVISRAFIWSETERAIRIDLDDDGKFSDENAVHEYNAKREFGVLGLDDPNTRVRESIGYAVRKSGDYVAISMGVGGHATAVAGAAAASKVGAGRIEGVAPGAQLLAVSSNARATSLGRAMTIAFSDPRTDVVMVQSSTDLSLGYRRKNGRSALAILEGRLVERYQKPSFHTAMNLPGMESVDELGVADEVNSVGAAQSASAVFAHNGARVKHEYDLHWVGAEGPSGDGGFKPDFLAPANPITTALGFSRSAHTKLEGVFNLPPGYRVGGGTSVATPVAAGAAAMLISAAKINGIVLDASFINDALRSTTKFLSHIAAYKQGRGILQIGRAWGWILSNRENAERIRILVRAPVLFSAGGKSFFKDGGAGLYVKMGPSDAMRRKWSVYVERISGPEEPMDFNITWAGNNDDFFESQRKVTLPLGKSIGIEVSVGDARAGTYSALMQFRQRSSPGIVEVVPATLVYPHRFLEGEAYSQELEVTLDRPGRRNIFFSVPEGVGALTFVVESNRARGVVPPWFFRAMVYGPDNHLRVLRIPRDIGGRGAALINFPESGIWQVTLLDAVDMIDYDWGNQHLEYLPTTHVILRAYVSGFEIAKRRFKGNGSIDFTFRNDLAPYWGRPRTFIGLHEEVFGSLDSYGAESFAVEVGEGSEFLIVDLESLEGGEDADLDLFVYDCSDDTCRRKGGSSAFGSDERVLVQQPRSGNWKVVVFNNASDETPAHFKIEWTVTNPRFGGVVNDSPKSARGTNAKWDSEAVVWLRNEALSAENAIGVLVFEGKAGRAEDIDETRQFQEILDVDYFSLH